MVTERRHEHGFQLVVNGKRTNIELDSLTLSFVPADTALRAYAIECITALGHELLPDLVDATPADILRTLAEHYNCGYAQVAKTAIARYRAPMAVLA